VINSNVLTSDIINMAIDSVNISEDWLNITNIKLGLNKPYGKIDFGDRRFNISVFNFSQYWGVSYNSIFINTTAIPNLNNSAILTLSDLLFNTPKILIDGKQCPSSICTIISYNSGTLIFNVTHFTTYSAAEGYIAPTGNGGGSSGGGGSG